VTPNEPNLHGVYEKLGEMTATLRDVSHTGRDNARRNVAIGELVIKQGTLHNRVSCEATLPPGLRAHARS